MKELLKKIDLNKIKQDLLSKLPPAITKFINKNKDTGEAEDFSSDDGDSDESNGQSDSANSEGGEDKTTKVDLTKSGLLNKLGKSDKTQKIQVTKKTNLNLKAPANENDPTEVTDVGDAVPSADSELTPEELLKKERSKKLRHVVLVLFLGYMIWENFWPDPPPPPPQTAQKKAKPAKESTSASVEGSPQPGGETPTPAVEEPPPAELANSTDSSIPAVTESTDDGQLKPQDSSLSNDASTGVTDESVSEPIPNPQPMAEPSNAGTVATEETQSSPDTFEPATASQPEAVPNQGEVANEASVGEASEIDVNLGIDQSMLQNPVVETEKNMAEKSIDEKIQEKLDQPKAEAEQVTSIETPDYTILGRGLVYSCKDKFWACVNKDSFLQCSRNHKWQKSQKQPLDCVERSVYATVEDCEIIQTHYVNTNEKTDFCNSQ